MIAPPGASVIYWPKEAKLTPTPLEELPYEGIFQDIHEIKLNDQLPAGEYLLRMGIYNKESGQFLPAYDEIGQPCLCERRAPLGKISISDD